MKKKLPVVTIAPVEEAAHVAELRFEATVALAEVAGAIKDGLLAFASATGLVVMRQMMEAELTGRVEEKHAKLGVDERVGNWHGTTTGPVVLGGRQVNTERPRGRTTEDAEIELDTWKVFSCPTCSTPSSSNACWPAWRRSATLTWPSPLAPTSRHAPSPCPSRPSLGASSPPPRRRSSS